jgi:hypothetical protein
MKIFKRDDEQIMSEILLKIQMFAASFALTSPHQPRARAGQFVGFSNSGLPLYDYGDDFLQRTSRSILLFVKETLREILANSDSRRIFFFLCANLVSLLVFSCL